MTQTTTQRTQTIASETARSLRLCGFTGIRSPYFPCRDTNLNDTTHMAVNKAVAVTYLSFNSDIAIDAQFYDGNTYVGEYNLELATSTYADPATMKAAAVSLILAYAAAQGYSGLTSASQIVWPLDFSSINAPTSYQTIVSQSSTAAPAVSGGFTPTSTYAAGTTFTWARTSAGVYTLTASAAVFNTAKTGVFVAPLQNLNASVRAIVTSTTVITVTTAVQSVAVLGLLGLTTTATDGLLSGTMLYIQTYA